MFLEGLDFFGAVVVATPPDAWERPSPCAGWRALDVLGHVGAAVRFGTSLLRGEEPTWHPANPPGAAVEGAPAPWWLAAAGPAREAVVGVDLDQVVDSPLGRRSIGEGLSFPAIDLFIHAWDLGCTAGIVVDVPDEVMRFTHAVIDAMAPERVRSPRVFAAAVPERDGLSATEAFIAWTGRDPRRKPT